MLGAEPSISIPIESNGWRHSGVVDLQFAIPI
jgi:hypothetical protein